MWFLIASTGAADRDRPSWFFSALILGLTAFAACNLVLAGVLPVTRTAAIVVAAGDLLQCYNRLKACVPADGTTARLGGDEFAVILPGADRSVAERVAADFIARLSEPIRCEGTALRARASVGVATGVGGDALLRAADEAMYQRKRSRAAAVPMG
jgi:predicted signal transduction protein with EAL and GGDEF domain